MKTRKMFEMLLFEFRNEAYDAGKNSALNAEAVLALRKEVALLQSKVTSLQLKLSKPF